MRLRDAKAVIIGGGSGIGGAIGLAFAQQGAEVAFLDIHVSGAETFAEKARACTKNSFAARVDVRRKDTIATAFKTVENHFGYVDCVVYSAGVSYIVPFLDCTEDIWDVTMEVNLKGMFLCLQSAFPLLPKKNSSSVICLSSQSGKMGASQYQAYCASKFGVIGMVQSLALEYAPDGIRVNAICPGVVLTPMWEKQMASYAKKRHIQADEVMPYFASKIPLARIGTVDDVSNLAIFLASNESAYITGQTLNVSGGQIMF